MDQKTEEDTRSHPFFWYVWAGAGVLIVLAAALLIKGKNSSSELIEKNPMRVSDVDGMLQVYVPAGEFEMGYKDGHRDEQPVHTVYLDAFWIDQTEVTNVMYAKCVAAGSCNEPRGDDYADTNYSDHPVVFVSWYDADSYCTWAGRELPGEAQWEKAARGTDGRIYPWGNDSPNCYLAQYSECTGTTIAVGSLEAGGSPYGALDMAGNVWEWVADSYDNDYYSASAKDNPENSSVAGPKVLRGGSWNIFENDVGSVDRKWYSPDVSANYIGFRCLTLGHTALC